MCPWTLGTIERRCGVTVLVKPFPESPFWARIPEIATFFFSFHVQINVRVEICRIARRPMCAYMCT